MKAYSLSMILAAASLLPAAAQEDNPAPQEDLQSEILVLDLAGAVDHAITYNKSLQNERMEVEKSRASVWESIAQGLPQVDGTLDYMTYFNYEMEFSFGIGGGESITPQMIQDAANQTLATGFFPGVTQQDLLAHQAGNFQDQIIQSMLPQQSILLNDASTAKLQVSQLIFSGQYIVGIQTAKLARIISEQNLDFNEQGI